MCMCILVHTLHVYAVEPKVSRKLKIAACTVVYGKRDLHAAKEAHSQTHTCTHAHTHTQKHTHTHTHTNS
jgi:hypothetical protein